MDKGPFAGIVAITRGGLIPAAIIARELDVRLVETVSIVTYAAGGSGTLIEEENSGAPVVIKPPAAAGDGTGYLIVDDLVDTGATARVVRGLLPRAHFAASMPSRPDARRWTLSSPRCRRTPGSCSPGTPSRSSSRRWQAERLITRTPPPRGSGWPCRRGSSAGSR